MSEFITILNSEWQRSKSGVNGGGNMMTIWIAKTTLPGVIALDA